MANLVHTSSRTYAPSRPRAGRGFVATVLSLLSLQKSRHDLSKLDAHMLNDIGLTNYEAECEGKRPIWDVPTNWRL